MLHLRAERKSAETVRTYRAGVDAFLSWCAAQGIPPALAPRSTGTCARRHRLASTSVLWLGQGGKEFGYHALRDTLRYRADKAGTGAIRPQLLRHTAAHR